MTDIIWSTTVEARAGKKVVVAPGETTQVECEIVNSASIHDLMKEIEKVCPPDTLDITVEHYRQKFIDLRQFTRTVDYTNHGDKPVTINRGDSLAELANYTLYAEDLEQFLNALQPPTTVTFTGTRPHRAHSDDAGLDLYAATDITLPAGGNELVPTSTALALPTGSVGLVCPRSGLAAKQKTTVLNAPGIIDAGYRGEIKVNLINHSKNKVHITKGDRIAQLVIVPVIPVSLEEVNQLDETTRGTAGHGSTGP